AFWLVEFLNTPARWPMRQNAQAVQADIVAWLGSPSLEHRLFHVAEALKDAARRGILIPRFDAQPFNSKKTRLDLGQGVYKIGNRRITFRLWWEPQSSQRVKRQALVALADLLVSGKLDRIRRCRECRAFFYASLLTKEYCKPKHQRAHDKRA